MRFEWKKNGEERLPVAPAESARCRPVGNENTRRKERCGPLHVPARHDNGGDCPFHVRRTSPLLLSRIPGGAPFPAAGGS